MGFIFQCPPRVPRGGRCISVYFWKLDLSNPSLHQELGNPSSRLCLCPDPPCSQPALGWLPEPIQQPQNSSRCSQELLQSCGMCRTSCPAAPQLCRASCCPIPMGLRAPPGCSDSGKKFPAPFTGSNPTSSACGWGLEEKHMDPNISENISVSYPRASQRQLGATFPGDMG